MKEQKTLCEYVSEDSPAEVWDEWLTLFASRNEVAHEYAQTLRTQHAAWKGWAKFNAAISRRWSPAGLTYIKKRAWKIATEKP